jgi:SAM-dependent methyltransferase
MVYQIDRAWIANKFDLSPDEVSQLINDDDLQGLVYEKMNDEDNQTQIQHMGQLNTSQNFRVSSHESNPIWEKGWEEVYQRLADSENIVEDILKPQYFGKSDCLRFEGQFIRTQSKSFEYQMDLLIRKVVFYKYLSTAEAITELGCGTGNSLLLINELLPNKKLIGADWATSSQKLLEKIAQATNADIEGVNFNMFTLEGKERLKLNQQTTLLTVHALEQLGSDFGHLLAHIIKCKPKLCIHLEPINEFYQEGNSFDHIAKTYHAKRNYLQGFHSQLKNLESNGVIKIIEDRRLGFGGIYHEAYNLIVWKVICKAQQN